MKACANVNIFFTFTIGKIVGFISNVNMHSIRSCMDKHANVALCKQKQHVKLNGKTEDSVYKV